MPATTTSPSTGRHRAPRTTSRALKGLGHAAVGTAAAAGLASVAVFAIGASNADAHPGPARATTAATAPATTPATRASSAHRPLVLVQAVTPPASPTALPDPFAPRPAPARGVFLKH